MDKNYQAGKAGIWELYGLKGNPFFSEPLLFSGGEVTIAHFHGREEELKEIQRIIFSSNSNRIIVSGDVGVGKTTLVNFLRFELYNKNYFTTIKEIGVQADWSSTDFILETLAAIYTTINRIEGLKKKISAKTLEKLEVLFGIERGSGKGGSLSVVGTGIGGQTSRALGQPQITITYLADLFLEVNESIGKTFNGMILHYNNLEIDEEGKAQRLKALFGEVRDFLQTPNVQFFLSETGICRHSSRQCPR